MNRVFEVMNKLINDKNKKKTFSKDTVQRLYYKYHQKNLGFNEVKRTKKLTEFIALNLAKKKSRLQNFEKILNPAKRSYSYQL